MSDLRKAAQQALIVLRCIEYDSCETVVDGPDKYMCDDAYDALKAALAQPEPVMFNGRTEAETDASASVMGLSRPQRKPLRRGVNGVCTRRSCECEREGLGDQCIWLEPMAKVEPTCTAPPQRKPLTEEEIYKLFGYDNQYGVVPGYALSFVRAIEKEHGIGGEA